MAVPYHLPGGSMHGSFALLASLPLWLTLVLLEVLSLFVMLYIRKRTEGRAYNPALSSRIGIQLLILIVLVAAWSFKSGGVESNIFSGSVWQYVVGVLAILYGGWRMTIPENPADKYHQLVVIPIMIWLVGTTLPYLIHLYNLLAAVALVLSAVFAGLVRYDFKTGRSKPRRYMLLQGAQLDGNYPC